MISLFGLALGPLIATQLLQVTDWRNVFMIVGIPGLFVAAVMWFIVREPVRRRRPALPPAPRPSFGDLFAHRNVPLAMLTLMCAMTGIFVQAAMMPNYLIDYLKLSTRTWAS